MTADVNGRQAVVSELQGQLNLRLVSTMNWGRRESIGCIRDTVLGYGKRPNVLQVPGDRRRNDIGKKATKECIKPPI
jgi:hypothetical protein